MKNKVNKRQGRQQWALLALSGLLLTPLGVNPSPSLAVQNQPTVLTIAVPGGLRDTFNDQILKDFEGANPGIQVSVMTDIAVPEAAFGLDQHLNALEQYASSADVLYVGDYGEAQVSPQATRAGYFLDLTPLVNADSSLNQADFVPAEWRSYQWDNGLWAIPIAANVDMLTYDPAAFDHANLSYPSTSWSASEFLDTVTKLTVKD